MKPLSCLCLLAWLALRAAPVLAQPGSGGPGPSTLDPTTVPLDGGASLLLAAGAAYGWRRLRGVRRLPL